MKLATDYTVITLANNLTPMATACKLIGMRDADYAAAGNAKIECPFASVYHPDGQKSFRIYENKSAYCYACGERYLPVSLYAQAKDISLNDAAEQLLAAIDYKPPTAENRFAAAVANAFIPDRDALASALKTYCARTFPDWEERQFDEKVAHRLRKCLDLLPSVRSEDDTKTWLDAAKTAMTRVLGDTQ